MNGFTKLYSGILDSSIWEEDKATRIVWITFLAKSDASGNVIGVSSRLAKSANVSILEFQSAIEKLTSPDMYSKTPDKEGRRLEKIQGGWHIINYRKYRNAQNIEKRRKQNREAKKRQREREKQTKQKQAMSAECHQMSAQAEAEAEAYKEEEVKEEERLHTSTTTERIVSAWQKLPLPPEKKAVDASCLLAVDRIVSELSSGTQEPIHEGMVLEAIENYNKALRLPNSQAFKHKLYPFLQRHIKKYVTYNFDLDHHDGSRFEKGKAKQQQPFDFAGHYCSQKADGVKCGKPAMHKYVSEYGFDYYRCEIHKQEGK